MSQVPVEHGGTGRRAIYISTEAAMPTGRLLQMCDALDEQHPLLDVALDPNNVLAIICTDLELQDHIMRFQLPTAVERYNIGLVIIDSIAANYRSEFERPAKRQKDADGKPIGESGPAQMARRGAELVNLGQRLKELARRYNLAVVVANQVSDRFQKWSTGQDEDLLALDYQARYFTGWESPEGGKVPALGLVWANLLGMRVALRKGNEKEGQVVRRRQAKVVFSGCAEAGKPVCYQIWSGGVRSVKAEEENVVGGPSIYG